MGCVQGRCTLGAERRQLPASLELPGQIRRGASTPSSTSITSTTSITIRTRIFGIVSAGIGSVTGGTYRK